MINLSAHYSKRDVECVAISEIYGVCFRGFLKAQSAALAFLAHLYA